MQPTPLRLSQALWTAFRAAKPGHQHSLFRQVRVSQPTTTSTRYIRPVLSPVFEKSFHNSGRRTAKPEIEEKIEDAKQRIEQSLQTRAEIAQDAEPTLKTAKDETIVHTLPESSSIVYTSETTVNSSPHSRPSTRSSSESDTHPSGEENKTGATSWASHRWQNSPLPSQIASLRSRATRRFTLFMDNLQSNIVVAAHHINDLTGYSGIERLKKEIEAQETDVQDARRRVKESRETYSNAITMRSTTQREVNDLLHRKHTWSPADLERFTQLYRSDHANEQGEQKAHQQVVEAEAQYEEASTRLAKSILARYHEEQIWSDKIRQMSTWGTWGLMGLNVLLFIIFQIAIEPWRRKRLVRGFEEKVQAVLDEKEKLADEKAALIQAQRDGDQVIHQAVQERPEGVVVSAAEEIAEAIVDAVAGATDNVEPNGVEQELGHSPRIEEIESVAEQVMEQELVTATRDRLSDSASDIVESKDVETPDIDPKLVDTTLQKLASPNNVSTSYHNALQAIAAAWAYHSDNLMRQFDNKEHVVLSKQDLTTKILEGVATGVALSCGIFFIFLRGRS